MTTFNTQEFLDFCRSKPADKNYEPGDPFNCALAQAGYKGMSHNSFRLSGFPVKVYEAAVYNSGSYDKSYFTFGALTKRLETLV